LRDQVRAAARQWHERGRPRGLLWRDEALAEYRLWRTRHPGRLTELEEAFAAASLADAARGRRIRRASLVAAFLALALGLGAVQRSALQARHRLAALFQEQGRQTFLSGEGLRAAAYLLEAHRQGARGSALHYLITRATFDIDSQISSLGGDGAIFTDA